MLLTLINIQELSGKEISVQDAPLHKELELLSMAIAQKKSDAYVQMNLLP